MSEELPSGGVGLSSDEVEALPARWLSCWTRHEVAQRLAGVSTPWCVAAGWALDLFRGTRTRAHGDIEIAIPAGGLPEVRDRFPGYVFDAVGGGRVWEDASPEVLAAVHQTWLRDPVTGDYMLDVFREPHDGGTWICRRDERVRLPYIDIVHHTRDGSPYLAPELVLLFKAGHIRREDQKDFEATVPHMTSAQRVVLAELLARVHPGHPWIAVL
ncbi:nucleotidyltransferase domain-containing protein [Streptomyces tendae]|uniref:nucleotidyltransferase domain-containing protein n=1 Tax=Streptomyces tendae TaxID=1932 RepID=UPI003D72CE51